MESGICLSPFLYSYMDARSANEGPNITYAGSSRFVCQFAQNTVFYQ